MKYYQIIPTLGPGGAEAFVVDLAVAFTRESHESHIIVLCDIRGERGKYLEQYALDNGVFIHVANGKKPLSIEGLKILMQIIRSNATRNTFLVHLPSAELVYLIACALCIKFTGRNYRVIHNTSKPRIIYRLIEPVLKYVYRQTIGCSYEVYRTFKSSDPRYCFIDNGVDPKRVGATTFRTNDYTRSRDIFMIGSLRNGYDNSQKGIDIALKAWSTKLKGSGLRLIISGLPSADINLIKQKIRELNITNEVVVRDTFRNIKDELDYVKPCLCIMPSRYEGLPITLIEYSMLGYPIVASDLEQINRIIDTKLLWSTFKNGDVDELANAILTEVGKTYSDIQIKLYSDYSIDKFGIEKCCSSYLKQING